MTFSAEQLHVLFALWMFYKQGKKPKAHNKCINVMINVVKFHLKNKKNFKVMLFLCNKVCLK